LHLKGWSQQRIADLLELDKSNICRELKKIKDQWKAEAIEDHNLYVQQELRRLAMLEA
jgi:IS30 family transposase